MGGGGIDPRILDLRDIGDEWSASRPGRFTPGERAPGTHSIGGWVGPKTGLDDVEKRKCFDPTGTRTLTPLPSSA
jgi:hypothetical protein